MPFLFYMNSQKPIPFEIIHLNDEGYHLKVKSMINNLSIDLIVDTGASQSAFDFHFIQNNLRELEIIKAEQISSGLGTNTMESYECTLDFFQIGDLKIENYKAALLDLSHVNQTYEKLNIPCIHGVLGNDILLKYNALIDYKNKQLWLST